MAMIIRIGNVEVLIDPEYSALALLRWHIHEKTSRLRYVCRSDRALGHHKMLHHYILPAVRGLDVDHVTGDTLDNRQANLQYLTHSQNIRKGKRAKVLRETSGGFS